MIPSRSKYLQWATLRQFEYLYGPKQENIQYASDDDIEYIYRNIYNYKLCSKYVG